MEINKAFGLALKKVRRVRGFTQEDFSDVSSRTYISSLERGLKSPTLEKVDALATAMDVHPLTVVFIAYSMKLKEMTPGKLISTIEEEIEELL